MSLSPTENLPRLMAISSGRALARAIGCPVRRWLTELADLVDHEEPQVLEPMVEDSDPSVPRASTALSVQLREKHLDDRALFELCVDARRIFRGTLLVNGRADLAVAAGLDGVQVPGDGVPVARLRDRFGHRLLIGVSTHSFEEIESARHQGADFVLFGPVLETPSKRGFGAPQGPRALRHACSLGTPVFAVGGIEASTLSLALAAGAEGVAAIRACADRARVERLLAALG